MRLDLLSRGLLLPWQFLLKLWWCQYYIKMRNLLRMWLIFILKFVPIKMLHLWKFNQRPWRDMREWQWSKWRWLLLSMLSGTRMGLLWPAKLMPWIRMCRWISRSSRNMWWWYWWRQRLLDRVLWNRPMMGVHWWKYIDFFYLHTQMWRWNTYWTWRELWWWLHRLQ